MHEKAHENGSSESRGDLLIVRGLAVHSSSLGVSGQCDVVEFRRNPDGILLQNREGLWQPFPVEYKRGKPKENNADSLQLCGQAMCLEEMLCCAIPEGALFYGETRRRLSVPFTQELRGQVQGLLTEMHDLFRKQYTPKVKPSKSCNACSLKELCLPKLMRVKKVSAYLSGAMEESS